MTSLRQRMTEDMQVRNLALNTQTTYVQQVSLFARHFNKSPEQLGPEDIRTYQVYLTNEKKLAPGSVLIAVAALRFLYKVCLALWQYLWVERPVQDSAPWKSPRAGVSPTRLRGQFEAQLSEQNMEAAARQHFA